MRLLEELQNVQVCDPPPKVLYGLLSPKLQRRQAGRRNGNIIVVLALANKKLNKQLGR